MKKSVIEFSDVSFAYDDVMVLEDVNFSISAGAFVAVVGPNGGGKSTLLKLMLGLLTPAGGSIRLMGQPPTRSLKRVGYMPQHSLVDLRFPVNVLDVVLMGLVSTARVFGPYSRADRQAGLEALEYVSMVDFAARPFSALSGGQRQRIMIARAIVSQPDLLLLDEPTANLDLRVGYEFYDLLQELNARMTILVVSHDVEFVSRYVTTVVCVQRKVAIHPTDEVTDAVIHDLYGGGVRRIRHEHDCIEHGCDGEGHK